MHACSTSYVAKEFFADRGVPSQTVTEELLADTGRLGWSLANIALAGFAKLGGFPRVVDARGQDADLIVGVGRSDVFTEGGRQRSFGYALAFVANGAYLANHSFEPAADERDYERNLTEAIANALQESRTADLVPRRVVVHLARRTGEREVRAAQGALEQAGMSELPVALLRIDDSALFEFVDTTTATYAPPKGLTLRLGEPRARAGRNGFQPRPRAAARCSSSSTTARQFPRRSWAAWCSRSSGSGTPTGAASTRAQSR